MQSYGGLYNREGEPFVIKSLVDFLILDMSMRTSIFFLRLSFIVPNTRKCNNPIFKVIIFMATL
jgi:hypothetical protein